MSPDIHAASTKSWELQPVNEELEVGDVSTPWRSRRRTDNPLSPFLPTLGLVALTAGWNEVGNLGDESSWPLRFHQRAKMIPLREWVATVGTADVMDIHSQDAERLGDLTVRRLKHWDDRVNKGIGNRRCATGDLHGSWHPKHVHHLSTRPELRPTSSQATSQVTSAVTPEC